MDELAEAATRIYAVRIKTVAFCPESLRRFRNVTIV